ncbi:NUDIX hydrolase [Streptomyces klenkii]|uniref:NUDIX hydrolase n=1 Tax=Streptomyces klenkii TaxID=1420899 RepID=UPI00341CF4A7
MIEKAAWILLKNGRILTTRSHGKDAYYLPGGKLEPGETPHQALIREIHEELGAELDPQTITHAFTIQAPAHDAPAGTEVRMACYTAHHHGALAPHGEIAEIAWLAYPERHQASPATQAVMKHLTSGSHWHLS